MTRLPLREEDGARYSVTHRKEKSPLSLSCVLNSFFPLQVSAASATLLCWVPSLMGSSDGSDVGSIQERVEVDWPCPGLPRLIENLAYRESYENNGSR
jgi:hypothetical protein